jgi:hypothetical protein
MNQPTRTVTGPPGMDRFIETAGLVPFSYVPPQGWTLVPDSGSVLTSWTGPVQQADIACALLFNLEASDKTAEESAAEVLAPLQGQQDTEIVSQGRFQTNSGLDAYKVVIINNSPEYNILMMVYFFHDNGYVIMAGYMRLKESNADQDAIIEQSMKTMRFE